MDLLHKYILLVDEYKLLTERNLIPARKNNLKYFTYQELVLKIILLRKFMMKDEEMYIIKVLNEFEIISTNQEHKKISDLKSDIKDLFNLEISYSLPNSKIQHLYHAITDLLYGLYLHSDTEKLENSMISNIRLREPLLLNFIQEFDPIIYKTYDLIITYTKINTSSINKNKKQAIIHYSSKDKVSRKVKNSPHWSNIDGHDLSEIEHKHFFDNLSNRDKKILDTANEFISALQEDQIDSNKIIKLLTSQSPIIQNLDKNSELFKSLKNVGISTKVRYSTNLKYAYVYFFENVEHPFSLDNPQLIQNVNCIRFKRHFITNSFKIKNFVNGLPPYYMSTIKNVM